ncbi:MAG: hypothetical protein LWX56_02025 [Ignavibacteria bacterium]|nr:hypothetical protein [Ignavibacteria bacterium]
MYRIEQDVKPPVSVSEWLITFCVACIPVVGVGMLIFWALVKDENPSKSNWAKAMLIFASAATVLWFLFFKPMFAK